MNVSSRSSRHGPRSRAETALEAAMHHTTKEQNRSKPVASLPSAFGLHTKSLLTLLGRRDRDAGQSPKSPSLDNKSTTTASSPSSSPKMSTSPRLQKLQRSAPSSPSLSASSRSEASSPKLNGHGQSSGSPTNRLRRSASARSRPVSTASSKATPLPSPPPFPIRDGTFPSSINCNSTRASDSPKVELELNSPKRMNARMSSKPTPNLPGSARVGSTFAEDPFVHNVGKRDRPYYFSIDSDSEGDDLVDVYLRSSPAQSFSTTYFTLPPHQSAESRVGPWGESEDLELELVLDSMAVYSSNSRSQAASHGLIRDRRVSAQSFATTTSTGSDGPDGRSHTLSAFPTPPDRPELQSWTPHGTNGNTNIHWRSPPPTSPPLQPLPPSPVTISRHHQSPQSPSTFHERSNSDESECGVPVEQRIIVQRAQIDQHSKDQTRGNDHAQLPSTPPMSPPLHLDFTSAWAHHHHQRRHQRPFADGPDKLNHGHSPEGRQPNQHGTRRARALNSDLEDEDEDSESASEWLCIQETDKVGPNQRDAPSVRGSNRNVGFGDDSGSESLSSVSADSSSGYDPRWSSESSHSMRELLRALGV